MANALADQLKELGLRHGEKAGVAVATMLFFLCVGMAVAKKTITTTPDEIRKAAQASEGNLNRREDRATIVQKLEDKGIKDTSFAKEVDDQVKTLLVADNYKSAREWVTPEPGAGLIGDTPKLIAPTELYAYPGRGGLLVYELDANGNKIPDTDKKDQPQQTRRRRRRRAGGMGSMMGGMAGGARKKSGRSKADIEREAKQEQERIERQLQAKLAGRDVAPEDAAKKEEEPENQGPPAKEIVKGYRWVAITGTLDHEKMRANYREALKNPARAHPNYQRLDLQRQTLQTDGTWTEWQDVDAKTNLAVLDNLPEHDEELVPENARPENLVDPLPFLKAGLWEKVHIASLVPKEKKEVPKADLGPMMGGGGMMRGGGMMGGMAGMMQQMAGGGSADMMKRMQGRMGGGGGGSMMSMMSGAEGRGGMMNMMGGGGSSETVGDYWKSEEKRVMIRALDFTVEPDNTYRYRVRIVVANPNYKREDIAPGVDNKAKVLKGPWSEETDPVVMPPDVMPYAMGTLPGGVTSDAKVRFQVIRFNLADGVTVPRSFEAPPGEVIGELRNADIPASDGTGKKSKSVDFNTHQIVLDASGGGYQQLPGGMVGSPVERPVLTLLLRPDGTVAVHNEAEDFANEVRKDIKANYDHEIAQSGRQRRNSVGMGMMGMMGGMGGMMGGMGGMMGRMGGGMRSGN